jgi:hypothetical protein
VDIAKAFTFVTEDEEWMTKIGIGALISFLSFLIIPIPLLVGYMVGVARNVMNHEPKPLPKWDDWGQLFQDGLSIIAAQFVYTLPFWLLTCFAMFSTIGFGALGEVSEDAAAAGIIGTFALTGCLTLLLVVALFFLSPAIVIQYLRTNDLKAAFRFAEVIEIARNNMNHIFMAFLATFGLALVLNVVIGALSMIPCLGWIAMVILSALMGPYLSVVTGHLYGQIANIEIAKPPLSQF